MTVPPIVKAPNSDPTKKIPNGLIPVMAATIIAV